MRSVACFTEELRMAAARVQELNTVVRQNIPGSNWGLKLGHFEGFSGVSLAEMETDS